MLVLFILYHYISTLNGPSESTVYYLSGTASQIDPSGCPAPSPAVNYFNARDPERMERLWQRIQGYRALLAEYHVKDEAVQARLRRPLRRERVRRWWRRSWAFP